MVTKKNPSANITGSGKDKRPWKGQDHSLLQQHPHALKLSVHRTPAGTGLPAPPNAR